MSPEEKGQPVSENTISRNVWLILKFVCIIVGMFSAFFEAHGIIMACQHYPRRIPEGTIEKIDYAKGGQKVWLVEYPREYFFPSDVLFRRPREIELQPGDHIEKKRKSFVYYVNGRAITNLSWIGRLYLYPSIVIVAVTLYLIITVAASVTGRRLVLFLFFGKWTKSQMSQWHVRNTTSSLLNRILVNGLIIPLVSWVVMVVAFFLFFSLVSGCLKALFAR